MMTLTKIEITPLEYDHKKVTKELWEVLTDVDCEFILNNNEFLYYKIRKGFKTNYRSGPNWIDIIAPQIGKPKERICWLIHDANYEGYLSQKSADNLLYYMLLHAGMKKLNCQIIHAGLRFFGGFNYDNKKKNKFVQFEYKIIPIDDVVVRKSRSVSEEPLLTDKNESLSKDIKFDIKDKNLINEKLNKIATENNLKYNSDDLEIFY